jgi:hypothetical protein
MTLGHFDESLKIAHDQYQFESLDSPGLNNPYDLIQS